ncbi:hypothetical protein MmiHf6_07330 [Methanimicrococcus hongohii]|uniref:DUF2209 domain-containing protein n=1 Tax=Methanimicrococcus hongohii TaxID=3028295 RepID=A0AA96UZA4_9EURY|nr:DUF2209 domain-containing protein [Methanimicrococcus sp. Hf6]WNY23426.1 hypothetical protein MmiHf6_07330 [Methanimicrococcus sp. Hf6]
MFTVIAVDISGRHRIDAGYYMVCAAASLEITPTSIEKVNEINTDAFLYHAPPKLPDIVRIIETTAAKIKKKGALIVERGDLFNLDENLSQAMFTQEIRYQESIGERKAIELAHYVSLSTRNLLLKETGLDIRIYENEENGYE